jgi:cytochrome c-type biogenesis protein CcsB
MKPLDSFAREVVLFETGSRRFHQWNPLDLVFSWIAYPTYWESQPLIRINREDVRRQLGLDEHRTSYSPQELFKNSILMQYAERSNQGMQGSEPPGAPKSSPREQELKSVIDRLSLFHGLVAGRGWLLIPKPAPAPWGSIVDTDREGELIRSQFVEVLRSYQANDQKEFERATLLLRAAVEGEIPHYQENVRNAVVAESLYNRTRPFFWSWVFYLGASLIWIVGQFVSSGPRARTVKNAGLAVTLLAVSTHIFGFSLRCFIAGRPPVTNMYESVIWVSLGVVVFAGILYAIHRQGVILAVATTLAMFGLIASDAAPAILDPSIHPLVPVLRSNYWLTIHVLTITLGYAAFALTLGLANITLYQSMKREKSNKIASLNQLTYRAMQFGVVLIAAGTILGGIWADYSWGRFWGWDPKEVWALITLLAYLVILHGRYTSWMGQFGFAAWSAVAFMTVVMAWYGVNFILGVGLHSYGFASGGTPWVLGFVAIQLAYVLLAVAVKSYWGAGKKATT